MDKETIKKKMEELSSKMNDFNAVIKDKADTVAIVGLESKDVITKKLTEAKGDLAATEENYRLMAERGKSKLSSELIRAQMNFGEARKNIEVKKAEVQKDIADKKYQHDKDKMEKLIEDDLEYADACASLAVIAAEEAKIAYLEAAENQIEYAEQFGDKKE